MPQDTPELPVAPPLPLTPGLPPMQGSFSPLYYLSKNKFFLSLSFVFGPD